MTTISLNADLTLLQGELFSVNPAPTATRAQTLMADIQAILGQLTVLANTPVTVAPGTPATPPVALNSIGGAVMMTPFNSTNTTGGTTVTVNATDPESRMTVGVVTVSRAERALLTGKAKAEYITEYKKGITTGGYHKIQLEDIMRSNSKDKDSLILEAVNILTINEQLKMKFASTESTAIFEIYKFGTGGPPNDAISKHDLFENWLDLTEEDVINSVNAHTKYGTDASMNEDIMWSSMTVLNSIKDVGLRATITNRLSGYAIYNQTGPLTLFLMLSEIAYCDERTKDRMSKQLEMLELSGFPNESIADHGKVWYKMEAFLKTYGKFPQTWKTSLLEQYERSSVPSFVNHFEVLASTGDARLNTMDSIIKEGQRVEREIKNKGKWLPTSKQGSIFHGSSGMGIETPIVAPPAAVAAMGQGPNGKKKKPTHNAIGRPIDYNAPGPNEPVERVDAATGRTEKWCNNPYCMRWGSHVGTEHDAWRAEHVAKLQRYHARKAAKEVTPAATTPVGGTNASNASTTPPASGGPLTVARSNLGGIDFCGGGHF